MITPDPTNRQDCCGAAGEHHYSDCPNLAAIEKARHEDAMRALYAIAGLDCICNACRTASE